ncbi:MAG: F0F1 ATP synthase subunit gamma [Synechocystis sp.]|nr:F0F1 ATP synthase subunit gamma [Synechocystis sp.]
MPTLETIRRQMDSIEDLRSVVRTMKALALVSIRQYEQARTALNDYNATVELALQALLHDRHFSHRPLDPIPQAVPKETDCVGIIVFGSEQGLCGSFNEQIADYLADQLAHRHLDPHQCLIAAVGNRLQSQLAHYPLQHTVSLPSSLAGIPQLLQSLLSAIAEWRFPATDASHPSVDQILLFHHQGQSNTRYQPTVLQLLPLDQAWLEALEQKPWPSPALPSLGLPQSQLLAGLVQQYLYVSLYRATVESLASENASRLTSMQAAEQNIGDRLDELTINYRQQRQNAITGELLDIVGGFEALKTSP